MWIVLIVIAVIALAVIGIFNSLIRKRTHVREAWSGIDVQLKRRYDLIPNIVETVKGYALHERGVLENVTKLRSDAMNIKGAKDKSAVENNITQALKTIFALAEAYPDLKANDQFLSLQKNLSEIESEIQLSRRYYNGTARDYNIAIQTFPNMIIANMLNFRKEDFFEIETATERETPQVKF